MGKETQGFHRKKGKKKWREGEREGRGKRNEASCGFLPKKTPMYEKQWCHTNLNQGRGLLWVLSPQFAGCLTWEKPLLFLSYKILIREWR